VGLKLCLGAKPPRGDGTACSPQRVPASRDNNTNKYLVLQTKSTRTKQERNLQTTYYVHPVSFIHTHTYCLCARDEHWTELGLDWIWTVANFVAFGLDPVCNSLQNSGLSINGNEMRYFCCEKATF